jgi:hypothetical protein
VRIDVTKKDIDRGHQGSGTGCPIAWALYEATGEYFSVGTWLCHDGHGLAAALPIQASNFIMRFDHKGKVSVEPFSFELPELAPLHQVYTEMGYPSATVDTAAQMVEAKRLEIALGKAQFMETKAKVEEEELVCA